MFGQGFFGRIPALFRAAAVRPEDDRRAAAAGVLFFRLFPKVSRMAPPHSTTKDKFSEKEYLTVSPHGCIMLMTIQIVRRTMKKKLLFIATLLLSLVLAFALIACDGLGENGTGTGEPSTGQGETPGEEPGGEEPGGENPGSGENPGTGENPGSGENPGDGGDTDDPGGDTDDPGGDTDDPGGDTDDPGEVTYTVTAEDWDIAFSAAKLGNTTIAIEQGGKVLMNVNNMFDTEPGIVYSETHSEGGTSRLYYVQYENGVLLYGTDQSGEWNTPQFAPYPMEQSLYWLAGFVGIFGDAVYSETENAYIVENFDFSQYGAVGTLKVYFENGFVQKITVDAGNETQNVVITFENYGDTQVELPADLPEYVPEAA